jgi:uncharacterized membrane protein
VGIGDLGAAAILRSRRRPCSAKPAHRASPCASRSTPAKDLCTEAGRIQRAARFCAAAQSARSSAARAASVHLREAVGHFGGARYFGAVYPLSHGLGKIVLVIEIFRGRLWAYPAMLVLLGAFIAYQVYRLTHGFTLRMFALTMFDGVIVWLTWRGYGRRRQRDGYGHHPAIDRGMPLSRATARMRASPRCCYFGLFPPIPTLTIAGIAPGTGAIVADHALDMIVLDAIG